MTDIFTKAKRSDVMSKIKGRGNRDTELVLAKLFRRHGITGWRRHLPLCGKPDFSFRKERIAIFVDGCFWHACPKHATLPKNNRAFWKKKFIGNANRDKWVNKELRKDGWCVVRIWEHDLSKNSTACIRRIRRALELH